MVNKWMIPAPVWRNGTEFYDHDNSILGWISYNSFREKPWYACWRRKEIDRMDSFWTEEEAREWVEKKIMESMKAIKVKLYDS